MTGVSISSKPCARKLRRMTASSRSRRAFSTGRKSRIPRGGLTWVATRLSLPCGAASAARTSVCSARSAPRSARSLSSPAALAADRRMASNSSPKSASVLGMTAAARTTPTLAARPSVLSARARLGIPCGIPSSTLVRWDFSTALTLLPGGHHVIRSRRPQRAGRPHRRTRAGAGDHLLAHVGGDILERRLAGLGGDVGVEDHLVQHVAELLDQLGAIAGFDGVDELEGLFHEVLHEAGVGLLAVPGAAAGRPQLLEHGDQLIELGVRVWARAVRSCPRSCRARR